MTTTNKALDQPAYDSPAWDVPLNANFAIIDQALGAVTSINITGIGTAPVVLTSTQYRSLVISFSGTLTANVTYQIPSGVGGTWVISNGATGAYTVTVASLGSGTSIVAPVDKNASIVCDGTNVAFSNSYLSPGGSNGQVIYNSSGSFAGSSNFTFDGTNVSIGGSTRGGDGTVSLPGFSFTSDTDCGLYRVGTNNIGIAVNGAQVLGVSATGLFVTGQNLCSDGTVSLPGLT